MNKLRLIFYHNNHEMRSVINYMVVIKKYFGNPKFPVDIPAIAQAAAKYNVALELNNSSFTHSRKGSGPNCRAIAAAVRDAGGWLSLGSDSHTAFTLGDFDECRKILDEVEFPEDRILNVSVARMLGFLEARGMAPIKEFATL